ncbi:MAG: alpha/beta hydrolase [Deltaproteobacteria bacterium]|nr:alpha/beta hydrolase [Deltaproteobacteria bacterium]
MPQEKILFANERGATLSGVWHHPFGGPRGAAILCHGMESTKNSEKLMQLADALAERGILALRFDFSYVGDSSGNLADITYSGEVADLRAAFELIARRSAGKVALFGSSMGGTVALLFAAQEAAIAGVATLAAPLHPEKFPKRILTPEELRQWRTSGFTIYHGQRLNVSLLEDLEKIDVPAAARRIACPVLILHGDRDEIVPVEEAYELYACLPGAKQLSIFRGADHRLSGAGDMRLAMQEALTWIVDSVG